jgi:hypothetical protein
LTFDQLALRAPLGQNTVCFNATIYLFLFWVFKYISFCPFWQMIELVPVFIIEHLFIELFPTIEFVSSNKGITIVLLLSFTGLIEYLHNINCIRSKLYCYHLTYCTCCLHNYFDERFDRMRCDILRLLGF